MFIDVSRRRSPSTSNCATALRIFATSGSARSLTWVSGETPVETDAPEMWLEHATVEGGELRTERLLAYEQHGRWIRWHEG